MNAHTPGPWKAQLARSGSNRLQVSGADGRQVALIWRHSPAETEANKLLIAAAPDLLEACRKALEWLPAAADHPSATASVYEAIDATRTALARCGGAA